MMKLKAVEEYAFDAFLNSTVIVVVDDAVVKVAMLMPHESAALATIVGIAEKAV